MKKIFAFLILILVFASFVVPSFATQYNWFSTVMYSSKSKKYTGVTGNLKNSGAFSYGKASIVNEGVPMEQFSVKFGSASSPWHNTDGTKTYYTTYPSFTNATVYAHIYRTFSGTTLSFEHRALVE